MDINKSRKIIGKMGISLNVIFIGVFVFWGNPLNIPKLNHPLKMGIILNP